MMLGFLDIDVGLFGYWCGGRCMECYGWQRSITERVWGRSPN